jgi:DNA polymerase-3 subunit alpha
LEGKKEETLELEKVILPIEVSEIDDSDDDLVDLPLDISDGEEDSLIEEPAKIVEPRGTFNFLNLDEIENFKNNVFANQQPDLFNNDKLSWKEKQALRNNTPEYMVAGLVTEYTIKDGMNSGEKVAFLMLEDYSGSYSFRLGDRDYMKLRDRIDVQRFVIFKIKFSQSKDGRVFVNVADVIDLKEAFEKFAKKMTVIVDVNDLRKSDLEFFKSQFDEHKGEQRLNFFIKNPDDESQLELMSMQTMIRVNGELLEIFNETQNYQIFLN